MRRLPAILVSALLAPASAGAAVIELNANAGFDANVLNVAVTAPAGGSAGWTATDLTGDTGSGALVLQGPPGHYTLGICLRPEAALPFGRHVFDFSVRAQGSAPAVVFAENSFAFGGDIPPADPSCAGPLSAYLLYAGQATVAAPSRIASSIPTYAFPLLFVSLQVDKTDAGPLLVDDWSVSVDTDVVFRDDDSPVVVMTH